MVIWFVLLVVAAYLVGSIPTAYLIGEWRRGIDIRQVGSGNVGASNVMAAVSKRWSIVVTIFDIGKGALMVWLAQLFGFSTAQQAAVGIAAIVGHNWTVFLRFQGGRGIFTTLGVIIVLAWKIGLIALVISYLFAPFRLLPLGVTIALTSLPVLSWFFSQPLGITERGAIAIGFLAIFLIAMVRRLTVPRSQISASVPTREVLLYRLLFDRDVRDRKTWITQTRGGAGAEK